jgi:hypothetical protein
MTGAAEPEERPALRSTRRVGWIRGFFGDIAKLCLTTWWMSKAPLEQLQRTSTQDTEKVAKMENLDRRGLLQRGAVAGLALPILTSAAGFASAAPHEHVVSFRRTQPPAWLMAMWKEIDDKTFGKGFDCFREDAICNLGIADWHGREAIRQNLRAFIDTGFTAHHEVVEYLDGGSLKVFRGIVTMTPNDKTKPVVRPVMTHFFYMDESDNTKVTHWYGSVGPVSFT